MATVEHHVAANIVSRSHQDQQEEKGAAKRHRHLWVPPEVLFYPLLQLTELLKKPQPCFCPSPCCLLAMAMEQLCLMQLYCPDGAECLQQL